MRISRGTSVLYGDARSILIIQYRTWIRNRCGYSLRKSMAKLAKEVVCP